MPFTLTDQELILLRGYLPSLARGAGADIAAILQRLAASAVSDVAALETELASTSASEGASKVGIQDAAAIFTATNVEAALLEARTKLRTLASTELTIASGVVTATRSFHTLDTESDGASDDLDTINGLSAGQFLALGIENNGRNVVLKHGSGNVVCAGGTDVTLDVTTDLALVFYTGTSAVVLGVVSATLANGGGLAAALASVSANKGASMIGIQDALAVITATTVEGALAEIVSKVDKIESGQATVLNGQTSITVATSAADGKRAVVCFAEQPTAALRCWADDVSGGNLVLRINQDNTANLKLNYILDKR